MTVEQPPLWRDGWDVEPCDTAPPDPDRRGHGNPYANAVDEPRAYRNVHTVKIKGELL